MRTEETEVTPYISEIQCMLGTFWVHFRNYFLYLSAYHEVMLSSLLLSREGLQGPHKSSRRQESLVQGKPIL